MSEDKQDIDWSLTTWDGSRRAQLRHALTLTLRERMEAAEGLADVARRFQQIRAQGGFKPVSPGEEAAPAETPPAAREPAAPYGSSEGRHEVALRGCTPEPLMNYLKALGVLRLVAEDEKHGDKAARGYWRDGIFVLRCALDEQGLTDFFLQRYQPTPIFSPWNGDGGFLAESGTSYSTLKEARAHRSPRLEKIHSGISKIEQMTVIREFAAARQRRKETETSLNSKYRTKGDKWKKHATDEEKQAHAQLAKCEKQIKENVVSKLRASFPDDSLPWLDACLLLETEGFSTAPLLGSGGVDGRMEFSANFLTNVLKVIEEGKVSEEWLKASLFQAQAHVVETSIGQFAPGRVGGPNATQGMEGTSLLNPWDYVLMIEGVVLFSGAISRKLGVKQFGKAAFPFTVTSSSAGDETLVQKESNEARGELWLPLWSRPACLAEIRQLLAEGRAEWAARQCATAVDFARAVSSLGVDRGISSFSRQGLLKRNGLAFIATPLGRIDVRLRAHVDLLREIDVWLIRFRRACGGKAPTRMLVVLRRIDGAVFDYCRYGGARHFQAILVALGQAERELMRDSSWATKNRVPPLAGLSSDWIVAANDGSVAFELALALAGVYDAEFKLGPLRTNLEPVVLARKGDGSVFAKWAVKDRAVVWNAADLASNMAAVLARRIMDGNRKGVERLPLDFRHAVSPEAIALFIAGEVDDSRVENLLWGLMLIDARKLTGLRRPESQIEAPPLPRAYALLKLLFLPLPLVADRDGGGKLRWRYGRREERGIEVRPEPRILPLLRADRIPEACEIAARRLLASGLTPMPDRTTSSRHARQVWDTPGGGLTGERLAAALLLPIASRSVDRLVSLVTRQNGNIDAEVFDSEEETA